MAVKEPCSRVVCLISKDEMAVRTEHGCVASRRIIRIVDGIIEIEFSIALGEDCEIMPVKVNRVRSLQKLSVM